VLRAENLRVRGNSGDALENLTETNTHPQAQITRALCCRDEKSWEECEKAVNSLLKENEYGKIIYHPAGSMKAVAYALLSEIQRARGDTQSAAETARTARDLEPESPLAARVMAEAPTAVK
jgi:predicted Zn-dependent protease